MSGNCNFTLDYRTNGRLDPPVNARMISETGRRLSKHCALPHGGGGTLEVQQILFGISYRLLFEIGPRTDGGSQKEYDVDEVGVS